MRKNYGFSEKEVFQMTNEEFLQLKKGDRVLLSIEGREIKARILSIRTDSHDGISQDPRAKVSYGHSGYGAVLNYVRPADVICKIQ